jgi:hypothetical protein
MEELRELLNWKPPTPRMSAEEVAALRAQLDREVEADDRRHAEEEERRRQEQLHREWQRRQDRLFGALRGERDRQYREREA